MKVLIRLLVLFLVIGLCAVAPVPAADEGGSDAMDSGDDDNGHTTIDTSDTVTINGQTVTRHYHYDGENDVEYTSVSDVRVKYDEDTDSTTFTYYVERKGNCKGNEDASVTIIHQGKLPVGDTHKIKLVNFTCSEFSSNPSIVITPNDGQIKCTTTKIAKGARIDCNYVNELTKPSYVNLTLEGQQPLVTTNVTLIRERLAQLFNISSNRVNVAVVKHDNSTVMNILIGPGSSSDPTAETLLTGLTREKLIASKIIKSQTPVETSHVVVTTTPVHASASQIFRSFPILIPGVIIYIII